MFHTNTKNGLTILTADTLSGVCHGFSTRPGGVSPAPWDSFPMAARIFPLWTFPASTPLIPAPLRRS